MVSLAFVPGIAPPDRIDLDCAHPELLAEFIRARDPVARPDFRYGSPREFRHIPTTKVLVLRDGLQMVWADATMVPTEMVDLVAIGDRADLLLVHGAVRANLFASDCDEGVCRNSCGQSRADDKAWCRKPEIDYLVVLLGYAASRLYVRVTSGMNGWLSAATDAKRYLFHWSSLLRRAARGASGSLVRVAPFYSLHTTALKGGIRVGD